MHFDISCLLSIFPSVLMNKIEEIRFCFENFHFELKLTQSLIKNTGTLEVI